MKKYLTLFITAIIITSCADEAEDLLIASDTVENLVINAEKDTDGNLVGVANKESFSEDVDYKSWFNTNYKNYTPNSKVLVELKTALEGVKIRAYMGTWCSDSRREIPKLYKILEKIEYTNIDVIGVNRSKKANGLEEGYAINYVPTIILYKNDKEIGRFVERVMKGSLENDLLQVAKGQDYSPHRK